MFWHNQGVLLSLISEATDEIKVKTRAMSNIPGVKAFAYSTQFLSGLNKPSGVHSFLSPRSVLFFAIAFARKVSVKKELGEKISFRNSASGLTASENWYALMN